MGSQGHWSKVVAWFTLDRRLWLQTFVAVLAVSVSWSFASPYFSGPDEPAHTVRAYSVAHGHFTGSEPTTPNTPGLFVEAPPLFASDPACFAFQPGRPADCLRLNEETSTESILTTAGRHPPLYYGIVGLPSWISVSGKGLLSLRVWSAALAAAFVASAMVTARRSVFSRWMPAAIGMACTPMCFYMFGLVNPSGLEISAAISAWVSGLVLVTTKVVDRRVLLRFVVAACALVLTRQLGLLWLALLVVTLVAVIGWRSALSLLRQRSLQIAAVTVIVASLAQLVWLAVIKPLDSTRNGTEPLELSTAQILRGEIGQMWALTQEWIGVFGWADTVSPAWVYLGTVVLLGGFVLVAVCVGRTKIAVILLGMVTVSYALPFLLEAPSVRTADYFWQGRYSLPFIVGIPIVAAYALTETTNRRFQVSRFGFVVCGVILWSIEVVAFWQALRRYSVGSGGSLLFFSNAPWTPPLPALLLIIVNAVAMGWWVSRLGPGNGSFASDDDQRVDPVHSA